MRAIFYRDLLFFQAQKKAVLIAIPLFTLWSLFIQQGIFTLSLFIGFVTIQIVAILQEDVACGYHELVYATLGAKPYILSKYVGSVIAASGATLILLPILLLVRWLAGQSLELLLVSILLSWYATFFILSIIIPLYLFTKASLSQVIFFILFMVPLLLAGVLSIKWDMTAEQITTILLPYLSIGAIGVSLIYGISLLFSLYYSKRS